MVAQGEVWWADLPVPPGSEAGYRRPVVVVQGDRFNRSRLRTALCIPLTSNLRWSSFPGNVVLAVRETGLPSDSVALVPQLLAVNQSDLLQRAGILPRASLDRLFAGLDVVLGR